MMPVFVPDPALPSIPKHEWKLADSEIQTRDPQKTQKIIQATIDACAAAGGGRVTIPDGCFLTGPLQLKSHVELHLSDRTFLIFSRNYEDYPLIMSYYEGYPSVRCTSPIWATDAEDIAITGHGIMDGNGDAWWYVRRWEQSDENWNFILKWRGGLDDQDPHRHVWWPDASQKEGSLYFLSHSGLVNNIEEAKPYQGFFRPCMIELIRCKRILLTDFTVQNSPAWTIHPLMCCDFTADKLIIKAPWDAPNTDGINMECTQSALVRNCLIDVGDDAVCCKAGKNAAGRRIGIPTRNIHIDSCQVYAAHGGFVIGSETACGIDNVIVEHCRFNKTDRGLRFKSAYGRGGKIQNIWIHDIIMTRILKEAISMIMFRDLAAMPKDYPKNPDGSFRYAPEDMPVFSNIYMDQIYCSGALYGIRVLGLPGIILRDIHLSHACLESKIGMKYDRANSFFLDDVTLINERNSDQRVSFDHAMLSDQPTDIIWDGPSA